MKTSTRRSIFRACSSGTAEFLDGTGRRCCFSEPGRLVVAGVAGDVGQLDVVCVVVGFRVVPGVS